MDAAVSVYNGYEGNDARNRRKGGFRYNKNLESINCSGTDIESADLSYNANLKSIIFYECSSLESITIPAGVTGIADYAFLGCNSLESVDASQCLNIQEIGGEAFLYCPIKEFLLGTSNPPVFTSGESIFDNLSDAVLKVPAESVEAYGNSDWAAYFDTIEAL